MDELGVLKERVESMTVAHQIEVLRILKSDADVVLNENSNGTFVYVEYVRDQQDRLSIVEAEKERIQRTFFNGDKGDKNESS
jgi:hypothetical protein